jgi:DNA repair exonuclease SbcCD ATPase subunit|tara:strand:+ start:12 stop:470 length:459 start_codon:yes stop_codon:yes gene_type:complete
MNTKQIILNKLKNARKESLSKKIDLSLVSDIDNEFDWLEQSYSDASYGVDYMKEWQDKILDFGTELSIAVDNYVVNGAGYSFEEAYTNMRVKIEELESKSEELGINPSELVSNYEEIKDILSNAESVDSEFKDAYKEVLREANERFGLADFS